MEEKRIRTWAEFNPFLRDLEKQYGFNTSSGVRQKNRFLFRGQANSEWKLQTTLERYCSTEWSVVKYLQLTRDCLPKLETFTGKTWNLPSEDEAIEHIKSQSDLFYARIPRPYYEYWVHLRHQGFPSPLLDWSASPYIAALFAFFPRQELAPEDVSIYIYIERPEGGKAVQGGCPRIDVKGPKIRTNTKHYLQQSWYTIAIQDKESEPYIIPHTDVFEGSKPGIIDQDRLVKVDVPYSQRDSVLQYLMEHNVNFFSITQTEEGLLKTLAFEELEQNYL